MSLSWLMKTVHTLVTKEERELKASSNTNSNSQSISLSPSRCISSKIKPTTTKADISNIHEVNLIKPGVLIQ